MKKNKIFTVALFASVALATTVITLYFGNTLGVSSFPEKVASENIHLVSLLQDKADPEIVLANVGDYVQFNAIDGKEHNLSQGSGNAVDENHAHNETGLESGVFKSDEAYKIQFKKVGIYSFHDHFNPDTYIRVIVDDKL
jgi:plastocyanin